MSGLGSVVVALLTRTRFLFASLVMASLSLALAGCSCGGGSAATSAEGTAISGITLDPPSASLAVGAERKFGATETFGDGASPATETDPRYRPLTWTTDDAAVATVDGHGTVIARREGATQVVATDATSGLRATAAVTVGSAVMQSLEVTPKAGSAPRMTTQSFVATAIFTDGSKSDVTGSVAWSSSDEGVATIGGDGRAAALRAGQTVITARHAAAGTSAQATLTVTDVALDAIAVTPASPVVAVGASPRFVATGTFHDGTTRDISTSVQWSSSAADVATFEATTGMEGVATARAAGQTTITALDPSGVSGTATLTVTGVTLKHLAITPPDASLPKGATQRLIATGIFSDGTTADMTARVAWTSSQTSVATVSNAAGTEGRATAASAGTTTITATHAATGVTASTSLVVTSATLARIEVTPPLARIAAGTATRFAATGIYDDGTARDLTASVTWSASDGAIATLSNAAGSEGTATGAKAGVTGITALEPVSGFSAAAKLTVTDATLVSVAVTPARVTAPAGVTQAFVATGTYSDGSVQDLTALVSWTSSSTGVATVASGGVVTTLAPGVTTVTATAPGGNVQGTSTLTVTATLLKSLALTPIAPTLAPGWTQDLVATGTYADGSTRTLTDVVTWSSGTASVATVSNALGARGVVTAASPGTSVVTALDPASGLTATATLTVTSARPRSVGVTPAAAIVAAGTSLPFTATGTYDDGSAAAWTTRVTWTSSDPAVASVSNAAGTKGLATMLAAGTAIITATDPASGLTGTASLIVTRETLRSLAITPPDPTLAKGQTQAFTATGTYTDGSHADLTAQVSWSSSDAAIATISNAPGTRGVASAGAAGTATVTAIDAASGVRATTTLRVTTAVLTGLALTPPDPTLPLGVTQAFTATGTFSDGSTRDVTASVTWASSEAAVAAISNAAGSTGVVTARAAGTASVVARDPATGVSGTTTVTVKDVTLRSLTLAPSSRVVPIGATQSFTAVGTYSDGSSRTLTTAVTWSSSATSVASIGNAPGTEGLATARAPGTATITATDPRTGVSGTASLTVSGAVLRSLAITPQNATVAVGSKQGFVATGTYSDGSTRTLTTSITWASSAPSVATISNASGSEGIASAASSGTTTVSATDPTTGLTASATLKATSAVLRSLAITPPTITIPDGATQAFVATGTYSDGTTQSLTAAVTWKSSAATVASISNGAGTEGIATAAQPGTTTITATDPVSGLAATATLGVSATVLRSIAVTPSSPTLPVTGTQGFVATGTYSDGTTRVITAAVSWSSTITSVATIANAAGSEGVATGIAAGTTTVTALDPVTGVTGSTSLKITGAALRSLAVSPAAATIPNGATQAFTATGTYSDGTTRALTTAVTWASSATAVATISNAAGTQGIATAASSGTTTIIATDPATGITASTTLKVSAATLRAIAVTPASASLRSGATQSFVATGTYSDGTTQALTSAVTWSSSSGTVAAVSNAAGSAGVVTGGAIGTATLTATDVASGIAGSATVTVTPAVLRSIAVTPINPLIVSGATQAFVATGTYTDGTTRGMTAAVTWSSSAPSVATISNAAGSEGVAKGVTPGVATLTATDSASGIKGTTTLTVGAAVLRSLVIAPSNASVPSGGTQAFAATGTFSDGSTRAVTTSVTWSSSATSVATVSNAAGAQGIATGLAIGSTTITATDGASGVTASASLSVTAPVLRSIAVTPPSPTVPSGTSQAFVATGTYSDGTTAALTASVTWSSSAPAVASISNAAGTQGAASALTAGTATITAADPASGIAGTATLKVTAAELRSLAVTPPSRAIPNGTTQAFTATGTYSDGTTRNLTTGVTWASSVPSVATVSNTAGSQGIAAAAAVGTTVISATDPATGLSASTTLGVTAGVLRSIAVTPPSPSIAKGTTQAFVATGTYSDGTTKALTAMVTWTSSSPAVASVSSATGSEGVASALAVGTATITAADVGTGIAGSATLGVTAAVLRALAITPALASVPSGTTQAFVATGTYSDGSTQALTSSVTWSSSATSIATLSNAAGTQGVATTAGVGSTTVSATDPATGITTTAKLTVTAAVLRTIAITPPSPSVPSGTTQAFVATGTYSDGTTRAITTSVTWSSSATAIATVSNAAGSEGVATSAALGTTTITATDATTGVRATATLTVTAAVLRSVAVTPPAPSIPSGTTQTFVAMGTYTDGTTRTLTTAVTWSSSTTTVASISNAAGTQGLATAASPGTTTISAADPSTGIRGTATLTVTAGVLRSVAITPATASIPSGTTQAFVATGTYSDGTTRAVTASVTWSSSATTVASISNAAGTQGIATGAALGTTTVTATDPGTGATATATLKVTAAVLLRIAVTPSAASIAKGTTQAMVATGTYSDGTTQTLTTSVTWTSSATSVATLSNAAGTQGIASGVGVGTATVTATDPTSAIAGSVTLKVTAAALRSVAVTPPSSIIPKGTTQALVATGTYSDGTTQAITAAVTWSSSSGTVASISNAAGTQGVATAASIGSTTLSATDPATGLTGTASLDVTAAVLRSLAITPPTASIANGTTQAFVATGTYSDGTTQALTTAVTWSSSAPAVASVSNAAGTQGTATGSSVGTTTISARDPATGISTTASLTITAAVLRSVAVTPVTSTIPSGTTQAFVATGTYSDGTTRAITSGVTWTSSSTSVATVSNAAGTQGTATGAAVGTTTITATDPATLIAGTASLKVTAAVLRSVAITPASTSIPNGTTQAFVATGTYSDGTTRAITTSVTWSSSSAAVASISNAAGSQGTATAASLGSTTIGASDPSTGISATATLTVTAAVIRSIAVTPSAASIPSGTTQAFVATATYTDATTRAVTTAVTWSSSATTVASISNAPGSQGTATAASVGSATLTARDAATGVSGTATLTVTAAVLRSIAITPGAASIPKGTSQAFVATGTYSDGSTRAITSAVTWSSSSTGVASISNAAGTQGIAMGLGMGSATLTATDPATGITSTATLGVTAAVLRSIGVTPPARSIPNGTAQAFVATGTYSDGTTQTLTGAVTWTSSATAVATVSNAAGSQGTATAASVGSATITATDPTTGINGSAALTVTAAVLRSIGVTPPTPSIPSGTTQAFVATGTYSDGTTRAITTSVTWSSSASSIASISNATGTQGTATGAALGTTTITATDPATGITGTATLAVTAAVLRSIAVTPGTPSIPKGNAQGFVATGTYTDGTTRAITTAVTWSSSAIGVATISNAAGSQGTATSAAIGTTTITATDPSTSIAGTATLKVTAAVLQRIAVTPAAPSIPNGTTQTFVATGTYSDGTTQALTTVVTWASSSPTIASISNAAGTRGIATGAAVGTTTISATDPTTGIAGTVVLTVTRAVLRSIDVSPSPATIAKGYVVSFLATGTYTDGTTQDLTGSVTWASTVASVATISNAAGTTGVASTLATGTTTITATDPATSIAGSTTLTVTPATLRSIQVTPGSPTVPIGNTAVMTATGVYSDATTQDLTATVTWSSSSTTVATVSNAIGTQGIASALASGTTTLTALDAASGISGTTTVTVTPASLIAIQITPTNPVAPKASQQQFYATGIYNNGLSSDLTASVTWSSSNGATATISNAAGTEGLATTIASGTSTITALDPTSGLSGSTTINVNTAVIVSIAVTPLTARIPTGARVQFTATATYNNGSTRDVTQYVSWSSSANNIVKVSNNPRARGASTGKRAGTATITATDGASGISGTGTVTVSNAALVSLAISPTATSMPKTTHQQFVATGTFSDGGTADMTAEVSWSSSSTAAATITSTGASQGYAYGVAAGTTTITATDPTTGVTASTTLTITAAFLRSVVLTPASPSVDVGLTRALTATGTFSDGTTKDITMDVTWLTASTAVATVSNQILTKGTATGVAAGSTTVTAMFPLTSVSATATLTVIR